MVQVLISTMNLKNSIELLNKMGIKTNAVIIDQCDSNYEEHIDFNGFIVDIYHTTDRGLSKSRNLAIKNSTADIVIFADDDFKYVDNYEQLVIDGYKNFSKAGILVFNAVKADGSKYKKIPNGKVSKKYRYSINSIRITAKRNALIEKGLFFDENFGAGTEISSGEDNIFISDCFSKKIKLYSCDTVLSNGLEAERASTWFSSYNEKFFYNRGAIYKRLSKFYPLFIFYFAIKNVKKYKNEVSFFKAVKYMFKGAKIK